jgi:hypothetical protein
MNKFIGKPCKRGHTGLRYIRDNSCVECKQAHNTLHADTIRTANRESARRRRLARRQQSVDITATPL